MKKTMPELLTRKQNRLPYYDYSIAGWYFITICSHNRKNIFGEINNKYVGTGLAPVRDNIQNKIELSKTGQIINNQWQQIERPYDNIKSDEYVIMPNHIHGIIIIDNQDKALFRTGASPVPTISNVIGSFKSKCSVEYLKYIKENNLNISGQIWQRSFYDHVIRNERALDEIRDYISKNPGNWENDQENMNKTT